MGHLKMHSRIDWLALWIFFSSWCSLSGWCLGLLGCLNPVGYGVSFLVFILLLGVFREPLALIEPISGKFKFHPLYSRKLLPKLWLLLVLLACAGGIIYNPNNYDYLTYRFPRVLHWCWEQKWHWIDTGNQRMNYSATGFEWLMVPLFVFFKTDRLFFLINFVSYLFLPGLVFSVFKGLGISKRISWWWMWVLPSGYCFALQAASAGNDSFAMVYLFAALHYALRPANAFYTRNTVLSCLSMALLTGAKASNLPLSLPWLVVMFFNRKDLLKLGHGVVLGMAFVVAVMASFFPLALLNIHFAGDYTGDPFNRTGMKVPNSVSGIVGNTIEIAIFNFAPPIWLRTPSCKRIIPSGIKDRLRRDYPRIEYAAGEMQIEERAGVGLGIVACAGLMAGYGLWASFVRRNLKVRRDRQAAWIAAAAAMALLIYMAKMGSEAAARLVAVYYPLIIAGISILASLDGRVVNRALFRLVGVAAMLSSLMLVILSPSRPLFPSKWVGQCLAMVSPSFVARYNRVYEFYAIRFDALKDLRAYIPENEKVIGFIESGEEPEVSLWRPFGFRQVVRVTPQESRDDLKMHLIHFIVVDRTVFEKSYHINMDGLIQKWNATIVAEKELGIKVRDGQRTWLVLYCP